MATYSRPHLPQSVRQWNGDSIGRWDGDTLVVDTTNYNGKGMIANSAATTRIRRIHESEALHVVERFKRVDVNTISYEVTIDDPNMFSAPWKVSMPLTRDANYLTTNTRVTKAITRWRTSFVLAVRRKERRGQQ